ncbi:hypothetical protein [Limnobacter sp.]|uniref:hypothetical protein n=1 Tax=Limnobacter sp. TaxID=2003368 RepID=UPI003512360E
MTQSNCKAQLGHWLAGSENGAVYYCHDSKVVSLCLHYMTLRFEPAAFRDLLGMMGFAQGQIERMDPASGALQAAPPHCGSTGGSFH